MQKLTPMMQQYWEIKEQNKDCILFFRLGDFYEMFDEDARLASRELDLTLTTRDRAKENPEERVPMCGVPYHSSEAYIARLIAKGYKVAICEQTEDPALAKGLVSRDVVRVITPGTVTESSMLTEGSSNYIAAIFLDKTAGAVCFADISTGEICATSFASDPAVHIINELSRFLPTEVILNPGAYENKLIVSYMSRQSKCLCHKDDEGFDFLRSAMLLCEQFNVSSVDDLGLEDSPAAVNAVGGLVSYIRETQKTGLNHINTLKLYADGEYMEMDEHTRRNLELTQTMRTGEKKGSLLWVLDKTRTPMGKRLLRAWVCRPRLDSAAIRERLAAVAELVAENVTRAELILVLKEVGDIERISGRIVFGSANGRDLTALSASLDALPRIAGLLSGTKSALLAEISRADTLSGVKELIDSAIVDEPPFSVREGGIIRDGYDGEVDRLRALLTNSNEALAQIETSERARTGKKLKIGYNKVFGYYIEIPRSASSDVPPDYIRKQTLANAERFITEELKNLEGELLTAKDRLTALEFCLFAELREKIAGEVLALQQSAGAVARADALCSLAEAAVKNGYCEPEVNDSGIIKITDGRHPVVEKMQSDTLFVPNDVSLDEDENRVAIITGPNMAGKSTYMRQTALIVLMAQMGSFVPAKAASLGIVDRVFTRIGASDDLASGRSTFMVEMTEVAEILKVATDKSLLILDEIGRGTSTYDGMSIARAVLEHCADRKKLGAKTLFATHYHELTELENEATGIRNYNIAVKKRGDDIVFLRKIVKGAADDSYGIEVAKLAGVPDEVIDRARDILFSIESENPAPVRVRAVERSGEENHYSVLAEKLKSIDINILTPIEAMNLLYELKSKCDEPPSEEEQLELY